MSPDRNAIRVTSAPDHLFRPSFEQVRIKATRSHRLAKHNIVFYTTRWGCSGSYIYFWLDDPSSLWLSVFSEVATCESGNSSAMPDVVPPYDDFAFFVDVSLISVYLFELFFMRDDGVYRAFGFGVRNGRRKAEKSCMSASLREIVPKADIRDG